MVALAVLTAVGKAEVPSPFAMAAPRPVQVAVVAGLLGTPTSCVFSLTAAFLRGVPVISGEAVAVA
jgi:hypothetical protein